MPFRLIVLVIGLFLITRTSAAADLEILGPSNSSAQIQVVVPAMGCTHRITGRFRPGDGQNILSAMKRSIQDWEQAGKYPKIIVCLDSLGGSAEAGLILARYFRDNAIGTKLEANARCLSTCALLFMAGSAADDEHGFWKWRVMHPQSKLGFHVFNLTVDQGDYTAETVSKAYAVAMETIASTVENLVQNRNFSSDGDYLRPSLLVSMLRTPPDEMFIVRTVDQAGRWGITIGPTDHFNVYLDAKSLERLCVNLVAWDRDARSTWAPKSSSFVPVEWGQGTITLEYDVTTGDFCNFEITYGSVRDNRIALSEIREISFPGGQIRWPTLAQSLEPDIALDAIPEANPSNEAYEVLKQAPSLLMAQSTISTWINDTTVQAMVENATSLLEVQQAFSEQNWTGKNSSETTSKTSQTFCKKGRVNKGIRDLEFYDHDKGNAYLAVRTQCNSKGQLVGELYRGDEVAIIQTKGSWMEVQCISGRCASNPLWGPLKPSGCVFGKYVDVDVGARDRVPC